MTTRKRSTPKGAAAAGNAAPLFSYAGHGAVLPITPEEREAFKWLDGGKAPPFFDTTREDHGQPHYMAVRQAAGAELLRRIASGFGCTPAELVAPRAMSGASVVFHWLRPEDNTTPTPFYLLRPGSSRADVLALETLLGKCEASESAAEEALLVMWLAESDSAHLPGVDRITKTLAKEDREAFRACLSELFKEIRTETLRVRDVILRKRQDPEAFADDAETHWDSWGVFPRSPVPPLHPDLTPEEESRRWNDALVRLSNAEDDAVLDGRVYVRPESIRVAIWSTLPTLQRAVETAREAAARVTFSHEEMDGFLDAVAPRWAYRVKGRGTSLDTSTSAARYSVVADAARALWPSIELAEERRRREKAEAETARLKKAAEGFALPPRVALPTLLVDGFRTGSTKATARKIEKKQLTLDIPNTPKEIREFWHGAEVSAAPAMLAKLTVPQVRAFITAYRFFSTLRKEGDTLAGQRIETIPAKLFWDHARATDHRSRLRLFSGLVAVAQTTIPVACVKDGAVVGVYAPLLMMTPFWYPTTDKRGPISEADQQRIVGAFTRWDGTAPWTEALPTHLTLDVPPVLRRMFKTRVFDGELLNRLDEGAKAIRGAGESFERIDFFLVMVAAMTTQRSYTAEDGWVLAYVDPAELLRDFYGPAQIKDWRKKGKLREKATAQYEKAVAVLASANVARREKEGHVTTKGGPPLDVFALNPDFFIDATPNKKAKPAPFTRAIPSAEVVG